MTDLLYLAITLIAFVASWGMIVVLERLIEEKQ